MHRLLDISLSISLPITVAGQMKKLARDAQELLTQLQTPPAEEVPPYCGPKLQGQWKPVPEAKAVKAGKAWCCLRDMDAAIWGAVLQRAL